MTRDEAIEIGFKLMRACDVYDDYSNKQILDASACSADVAVALGMLKLDEPKSIRDEFAKVWHYAGRRKSMDDVAVTEFLQQIDAAGLKIDFK